MRAGRAILESGCSENAVVDPQELSPAYGSHGSDGLDDADFRSHLISSVRESAFATKALGVEHGVRSYTRTQLIIPPENILF